ncbi:MULTISPECIES: glycosyltransferase family 4 protein [unclassified Carboxylicivirga]|uniref:glycosyltransferase family 4 protein n=1 Tax=Carboxylicivirga TaxID=1628153 RepID=UPI003D344CAE
MNHPKPHIALFGLKGFPAIGGTATVGENLVQVLGNEYRFTVYATESHASNRRPYEGVRLFIFKKFLPHKFNIFYYNLVGALHALLFGNYDLVHTHQIDIGYIVPLLRLRYKVVATHHGRTYQMDKWGRGMRVFFRITEQLMFRFANHITFVSQPEHRRVRNVPAHRSHYIPNGVNPNQAVAALPSDDHYIMFAAGRIIPLKGCHIFLEALTRMKYKGKVLIVGDYTQLEAYGQSLLSYRKHLNVEFLGMIKDKALLMAYVKKAQVFVFPSSTEAMSMMLLEVAMMRTPLICSDIPANKAIFSNDEVEYFRVDDVADLASTLDNYLKTPKRMEEKCKAAYSRLMANYRWSSIAQQYNDIYQVLLYRNRGI